MFAEQLKSLEKVGAEWVQIDEPCLVLDLDEKVKALYTKVFNYIRNNTHLKIVLTTYFGGLRDNAALALSLPVEAVHVDFVRAPEEFDTIINAVPDGKILSLCFSYSLIPPSDFRKTPPGNIFLITALKYGIHTSTERCIKSPNSVFIGKG